MYEIPIEASAGYFSETAKGQVISPALSLF
jgi:hypothetical protein